MTSDEGADSEAARRKVLTILNKGGYALEMRVAEQLRKADAALVTQSQYYPDPETNKPREIDVVGYFAGQSSEESRRWIHLFLVIECKSKPAPWVIFDGGKANSNDPVVNLIVTPTFLAPTEGREHTDVWKEIEADLTTAPSGLRPPRVLFTPTQYGRGSGIVEARESETRGGPTDKAWAAVKGAVSAARGISDDFRASDPEGRVEFSKPFFIAWFPVVVTSGKLYRSWLNEAGEMDLAEIDRGSISIPTTRSDQYTRCIVVTEAGLGALLEEVQATLAVLS